MEQSQLTACASCGVILIPIPCFSKSVLTVLNVYELVRCRSHENRTNSFWMKALYMSGISSSTVFTCGMLSIKPSSLAVRLTSSVTRFDALASAIDFCVTRICSTACRFSAMLLIISFMRSAVSIAASIEAFKSSRSCCVSIVTSI